jgi:type IV pilus assembly protein PilA
MKSQKGFSLVELLVVVIIIAIIAAIAIPNLLSSRRVANEAAAVSSLRTVHSAQATYQALNTPVYGSLADLGPSGGKLIDGALAAGTKDNYGFVVHLSTTKDAYCAVATPSSAASGVKVFGVDGSGSISVTDQADATNIPACSSVGVLTGGVALQ